VAKQPWQHCDGSGANSAPNPANLSATRRQTWTQTPRLIRGAATQRPQVSNAPLPPAIEWLGMGIHTGVMMLP